MTGIFATAEEGRRVYGDCGIVYVGDGAVATGGRCCTAIAGDSGRATAGDCGLAIVGAHGAAIAGAYGIAFAEYGGTASAGGGGTLILDWFDRPAFRHRRVVRYVGEDGIEPGVAYRCTDSGEVVPAVAG